MNWLSAALASSVGRKFVMGLTGLFLCLFLLIHLGGNLLLYVGSETYNHYAETLHKQAALLIVAEIVLYAAFLAHILIAVRLTRDNWAARQTRYLAKQSKLTDRTIAGFVAPEAWMFFSGAIVLLFIIVHVCDFKFEVGLGGATEGMTPYEKAAHLLQIEWKAALYIFASVVLGLHVGHGFASAFQSLGVNHPKYNALIHWASVLFAWVVAVGFASFPMIWYWFGGPGASTHG